MTLGLLGQKVGMMRIFDDNGVSTAVTVLYVGSNKVSQVKTTTTDGYNAVQVSFGKRRANRVSKAKKGHFAKANMEAGTKVGEFRIENSSEFKLGDEIKLDIFAVDQLVDVSATSKGKGFEGGIKRHNFSSNRASHGNSRSHNTPGSIGQRQDPGRVFPGKKMAGHLGDEKVTIQNLKIVKLDPERNLMFVKGAIPGFNSCHVVVSKSKKAS